MNPLSRVLAVGFVTSRSLFSRPTTQTLFRGHERLFRPHVNFMTPQIPLSSMNFRLIQARGYSTSDDSTAKIQERLWDTRNPLEIATALDLGADINAQDTRALDPKHDWSGDLFNLALAVFFPPVLLLSYISRIKTKGLTPLMYAAKRNNLECAKILIGRGANVNLQDQLGRTALMFAARYNNKEVAKFLVDHADLNVQNKEGETALMLAAEDNYFEVTQFLLAAGADKTIVNAKGETAIDLAAKNGHLPLAKLIERY